MLTFAQAVRRCVREKPLTLKGRACRSEFWWFMLALLLSEVAVVFLIMLLPVVGPLVGGAFFIASSVLSITVSVRRLHDLNLSGWWILALFLLNFAGGFGAAANAAMTQLSGGLSLIALIIFIVLFARRGTAGPNRFGPDPLEPPAGPQNGPFYGGPGGPWYNDPYSGRWQQPDAPNPPQQGKDAEFHL